MLQRALQALSRPAAVTASGRSSTILCGRGVGLLLQTPRLRLGEIEPEDAGGILTYRTDPQFLRFYAESEYTEEHTRAFIQRFLEWQAESPRRKHPFAVLLQRTGALIGICSVRKDAADSHEAEIGFELSWEQWGHGYATELGEELLRFGFEDLHLHRIQAHCIAENHASARVLEKLGMRLEGTLRDKQFQKGRYWDELWFAILQPEWLDKCSRQA